MAVDNDLASEVWNRYQYLRDEGHNEFVEKADQCEKFFRGLQWNSADIQKLRQQRRPALTINKIISTISNVLGEQIQNRTDITFQPRSGAPSEVAEALTKVFRQIADNNQLEWKRSDMFCDGIITSRGFLDVRMDFKDSMLGEVVIDVLNPKNVLIDSDSDNYDPDNWNDVFTTKWMTHEDIEILYGKKNAELLKGRDTSWFQYGFDSIERFRDRVGNNTDQNNSPYALDEKMSNMLRNIRVLDRQHRKVAKAKFFVEPETGDMREIPDDWDRNRIALLVQQTGLQVVEKLKKRIRWTVIADNVVLHDEWSPYEHFTVVPYFPYFRYGKTIGLVENLIGPQEMLNKISSQELHVVNTTANSGWKIKAGALRNMNIEELEQRGAETGLVLELDDVNSADKINPNPVPTGLDRLTYKAEEHIKTISGVSDYQMGSAREDVSAKAVQQNLSRGSLNQAKATDSLARTDFLLARTVLSLVQRYYTEPRIINITHNRATSEQQQVEVNQPTPEGTIQNDLTLGEYDIVVMSIPHRDTLEQSQFEQAVALREMQIPIPDEVLIEHSQLYRKGDILKRMQAANETPEAQAQQQMQIMAQQLDLANMRAEAARMEADTALKQAKAMTEQAKAEKEASPDDTEERKLQMEMEIKREEFELRKQEMEMELQMKREELELKRQELELKLEATRATTQAKVEQVQLQGEVKAAQAEQQMSLNQQQAQQQAVQSQQQHEQSLTQGAQQHEQALKQTKETSNVRKPNGKPGSR